MLLCSLIEEINEAVLPKLLHPIRAHLAEILAPFEQAESLHVALLDLVPQQLLDALVLAWHHEPLSYQSHAKQKRYHQHESQQWLDCAEGLLDHQFALLKTVVFEKLDAIVQATSLGELVNAFIRPSLNSAKGQITQETLKRSRERSWKCSATRRGWSKGIGGYDAFMKLCASSSGCETRPAKGEPARAGSKPCDGARNGLGDA
jgi:hypothetical protein